MISFNGITEISLNLTVKDIERAVLPPVKNRLVSRSGVDGAIDFGADLDMRTFKITFQSKETLTKETLQTLRMNVAAWLFPDRFTHQLTFDDEPGFYYMAKIDSGTEINQILEYGSFSVDFVCPTVEIYSTDTKSTFPIVEFLRNSTAYNLDYAGVAVNEPRYYNNGLVIEKEVTNNAHNASFVSTPGTIPDDYSEFKSSTNGTHVTSGSKYTATITSSTAAGAFFGIRETPGTWHLFGSSSYYSCFVLCRVVSGNVKARIKLSIFDSGWSEYYKTVETTSTSFVVINFEGEPVGTDNAVGIGFEAVAINSGDTGVCEFIFPQLEVESGFNNLWYTTGTKYLDDARFRITPLSTDWSLGITLKPLWSSSGVQGSSRNAGIMAIHYDSNNYIAIVWNSSTSNFEFRRCVSGSVLSTAVSTPTFARLDTVRLLITQSGDDYTIATDVNGGTVYTSIALTDSRTMSTPRTFNVGRDATDVAANGIVSNIEYDPSNYFA